MLRERARLLSLGMFAADMIAVACANIVAAMASAFLSSSALPDWATLMSRRELWITSGVFMVCYRFGGIYVSMRVQSLMHEFLLILRASGVAAVVSMVFLSFMKLTGVAHLSFTIGIVLTVGFVFLSRVSVRLYLRWLRLRGRNFRNYLIVGSGERALRIAQSLREHPHWGIHVIGLVREGAAAPQCLQEFVTLGSVREFPAIAQKNVVDVAVFAVEEHRDLAVQQAFEYCRLVGIEATMDITPLGTIGEGGDVQRLNGSILLHYRQALDSEYHRFLKRVFDVCCASIALLITFPVMAVTSVLVKLSSPGPILFRQSRVGTRGRLFTLYKFRTMVENAEAMKSEIAALNEMDGPVFKIRNDPRVTKIGRYLRKTSLDELPQLWNVLIGDMSIVGPRPPLRNEVDMYDVWHLRRLSVKPGITCLWQVSGRNALDFQSWMKLDMEYIDQWSWWLDLKIIALTFPAMLKGL